MHEILVQVEEIVKQEADENDWQYHIKPVMYFCEKLANLYNVDPDLAKLGGLLHDIGRIRHGSKDHHITGIKEAKKILKNLNCPPKIIDKIIKTIRTHRGHKDDMPKDILGEIVMNADALAHLSCIPFMIYEIAKEHSLEETVKISQDTIQKDWTTKLTLAHALRIASDFYHPAFMIFANQQKYHIT